MCTVQLGPPTEIRPHVFSCSVLRLGISLMTIRLKDAYEAGIAQAASCESLTHQGDD